MTDQDVGGNQFLRQAKETAETVCPAATDYATGGVVYAGRLSSTRQTLCEKNLCWQWPALF